MGRHAAAGPARPVRLTIVTDDDRPRTRGDCANVPRPCPYVTCKWSLFLDVGSDGRMLQNFPLREPHEMPPESSCALDVADRGTHTLAEVAAFIGVTTLMRVDQIEGVSIKKLRLASRPLRKFVEGLGPGEVALDAPARQAFEAAEAEAAIEGRVLEFLRDHPGDHDRESIAESMHVDAARVGAALLSLRQSGDAQMVRTGRECLWSASEVPQ